MNPIYFSFTSIFLFILQENTIKNRLISILSAFIPLGIYLYTNLPSLGFVSISIGLYWALVLVSFIVEKDYKVLSAKPILYSWLLILGERVESLPYAFVYIVTLIVFSQLFTMNKNASFKNGIKAHNETFVKVASLSLFVFLGIISTGSISIFANALSDKVAHIQYGLGLIILLLFCGQFESVDTIKITNKTDKLINQFIKYNTLPIILTTMMKSGAETFYTWGNSKYIILSSIMLSPLFYLYHVLNEKKYEYRLNFILSFNAFIISTLYIIDKTSSIESYFFQMAVNSVVGYFLLGNKIRSAFFRKVLNVFVLSFPLSPIFIFKFDTLRHLVDQLPLPFTILLVVIIFSPMCLITSFDGNCDE